MSRVTVLGEGSRNELAPVHRHHAGAAARACPAPGGEFPVQGGKAVSVHYLPGQIGSLVRIFGHRSAAYRVYREGVTLNELAVIVLFPSMVMLAGLAAAGQVALPVAEAISGWRAQRLTAPHHHNDKWPGLATWSPYPGRQVSIVRVYSIGVNVAVTVVSAFMVKVQGSVPLHPPPLQPLKV